MKDNEKDLLLDHDYDGIQELDHPLPMWWLFTFYGAIVFAIGYYVFYTFMDGPTLKEEYKKEMAVHVKKQQAYREKISDFDDDKFSNYIRNEELVAYGQEIFEMNCVSCHKAEGLGDIGPNLADNYWLYAEGTPDTVFEFILQGNPEGGMPSWVDKLEEDDLYALTSYIMSLQGTNKSGKEPQGEQYPVWNPNSLTFNYE